LVDLTGRTLAQIIEERYLQEEKLETLKKRRLYAKKAERTTQAPETKGNSDGFYLFCML
jgi:hypothetical protein